MDIKIFNMDGCTWIAARSVEEAWLEFFNWLGYEETPEGLAKAREDFSEYTVEEVSDADMDWMILFVEDPYDKPDQQTTFREQLAVMLDRGEKFPCFFATTEY